MHLGQQSPAALQIAGPPLAQQTDLPPVVLHVSVARQNVPAPHWSAGGTASMRFKIRGQDQS